MQSIVPIGALFSGTLWFGNAAYAYLSVSFIQMLKALMPAAVYTAGLAWVRCTRTPEHPLGQRPLSLASRWVGCGGRLTWLPWVRGQGVNRFDWTSVAIMGTVTLGVMIASFGAPSTRAADDHAHIR